MENVDAYSADFHPAFPRVMNAINKLKWLSKLHIVSLRWLKSNLRVSLSPLALPSLSNTHAFQDLAELFLCYYIPFPTG